LLYQYLLREGELKALISSKACDKIISDKLKLVRNTEPLRNSTIVCDSQTGRPSLLLLQSSWLPSLVFLSYEVPMIVCVKGRTRAYLVGSTPSERMIPEVKQSRQLELIKVAIVTLLSSSGVAIRRLTWPFQNRGPCQRNGYENYPTVRSLALQASSLSILRC
jgi:hypothetical protein